MNHLQHKALFIYSIETLYVKKIKNKRVIIRLQCGWESLIKFVNLLFTIFTLPNIASSQHLKLGQIFGYFHCVNHI